MSRKLTMRTLAAILLVLTRFAPVLADDELPVPADEYVHCTVCHGVQFMGNAIIRAPRLSGMDSWYIENQLRAFKNGWRGQHERDFPGMEMQPMAAALTDDQIREVAKFVESTQSDPPPVTIAGDADRGKSFYSTCAACHGVRGEGNIALGSPALTGLNDWYLVTQLEKFKNGMRGRQPGDTYGMQMRSSVGLLPDDQAIHDVVKYITTLNDQ